jgi:hypothetical protein
MNRATLIENLSWIDQVACLIMPSVVWLSAATFSVTLQPLEHGT